MRLIDADELLKQIKYKPIPNIVNETWNELYERVIEEIDNAPTVDAVVNTIEVRPQGKWIRGQDQCYNSWFCSICNTSIDKDYDIIANYCPYCGAQMRQEESE